MNQSWIKLNLLKISHLATRIVAHNGNPCARNSHWIQSWHSLISSYKRAPALLTTIGPTTYTLLSKLFALAEITAALTKHFEPTRQLGLWSLNDFISTDGTKPHLTRRTPAGCTSSLQLRGIPAKHYVTGSYAQKRDYCLKLTLAQGMEAADRNTRSLKGINLLVVLVGGSNPAHNVERLPIYHHIPSECRFKDAECYACGQEGTHHFTSLNIISVTSLHRMCINSLCTMTVV